MSNGDVTRRGFLKTGGIAGAGLLLTFTLPERARAWATSGRSGAAFTPNAMLRIGADDSITVFIEKAEMGQGVMTSLPMILCEELEADWTTVRAEFAPVDKSYVGPKRRSTGGSTSVRTSFDALRKVGATARVMLVSAAAAQWGVPDSECRAQAGAVLHSKSGRQLRYGALADAASALPVPNDAPLKDPKDFTLIGRRVHRLDTPSKVDGSAKFGMDVKVPGMLVATVVRCAACGGRVKSFDATSAKQVLGVRHVVQIDRGVAVVADSMWPALQGRRALSITWDEAAHRPTSSAAITTQLDEALSRPGVVAYSSGTVDGERTIEARYRLPFVAHAPMEPLNCTASVSADLCELWVGTQNHTQAVADAVRASGLPADAVRIHSLFVGGGFGRRLEADYVFDAVQLSKAIGAPVKLVWTREDDVQHDFYRPATHHQLAASLGDDGLPSVWTHHIAAPSVLSRVFPKAVEKGLDGDAVSGAVEDLPYAIPNRRTSFVLENTDVPIGWWRSVGHSHTAFAIESFVDEVAVAAKTDPVALRRRLLAKDARAIGVLELAASKSGWGSPLPARHGRGIALVANAFGSWIAEVAEVSVDDDGTVRVHRVTCAIDCGRVINPDTIEAQLQSGVNYGLSAALRGEITLADGRVEQSNFHDYRVMRMNEAPVVEVHIVPSGEAPGGVGEPGTPPIAPAVANAIFAAVGKRVRTLPIRPETLKA